MAWQCISLLSQQTRYVLECIFYILCQWCNGTDNDLSFSLFIVLNFQSSDGDSANGAGSGQPTQETIQNTPYGMGSMGGLPGLSGFGMGNPNFMEMQQQMQQEVWWCKNPDLFTTLLPSISVAFRWCKTLRWCSRWWTTLSCSRWCRTLTSCVRWSQATHRCAT